VNRISAAPRVEAGRVLAEFGVTHPDLIKVEAIAYGKGAVVEYAPLKGASGRLIRDGDTGIIRVDSGIEHKGQRRFAVAHELGHFILHRDDRMIQCLPEDMLAWYNTGPEEQEANTFAAELLMPEDMFKRDCRGKKVSLETLEQLASRYKASLTATAIRYVDLAPHVCALVQCHRANIRWFHPVRDFRYRVFGVGTRAQPGSGAHAFFTGHLTAPESEEVLATCWLDDNKVERDWTIREITIPMPLYESTLSVLWIEPDSPLDLAAAEGDA